MSNSNSYTVSVREKIQQTPDSVSFILEIPKDIQDQFQYLPGQYITFVHDHNGEEIRRSYSLCSAPHENQWQVGIKKIEGGAFSSYAHDTLQAGDSVRVMLPQGNFGKPRTSRHDGWTTYAAFAAGSGITPILSLAKHYLENDPHSKFKLFYLNKNVKSIMFKEELEQLRNRFMGRLELFYFLSREQRDIDLFNGRFDEEKLETLSKSLLNVPQLEACFLCGPEQMVNLLRGFLTEKGLDKERLHFELFVTGLDTAAQERLAKLKEQQKEGTKITLIDGAKEFHFTMDKEFDNILDAALAAGADLPYACKGGVCSTCKCSVDAGKVDMRINYALEDDEVARGLVLSCQAVPLTDAVTVNFDV